MNVIIIGIDLINSCCFIKKQEFTYLWPSKEDFIQDTDYPFKDSTLILSYEPVRGIFAVERTGGEMVYGPDLPEMSWVNQNVERLLEIGRARHALENPPISIGDMRLTKLYETDWVITRKQEQDLLGISSPLSDDVFQAVLQYRQQLRDITLMHSANDSAESIVWPINPLST